MPNSGKKVGWKCKKCGFEYEAVVSSRNRNMGTGCPVCSNKRVLKGYNDLATTNPKLAAEWNYDKNNGLTPDKVVAGSGKKVWWRCPKCKNGWEAVIAHRNNGGNCPKCYAKKQEWRSRL
jgi:rubrerythrin